MLKIIVLAAIFILNSANLSHASPKTILIEATVTYRYSIQIETIPGYIGEKGIAKVIFEPAEGFKWNKSYPSSFEIISADSTIATLIREEINFKDGILCVPYRAKNIGRSQIKGLINFSICNKEECLIFRNEQIALSLIVLKNKSKIV